MTEPFVWGRCRYNLYVFLQSKFTHHFLWTELTETVFWQNWRAIRHWFLIGFFDGFWYGFWYRKSLKIGEKTIKITKAILVEGKKSQERPKAAYMRSQSSEMLVWMVPVRSGTKTSGWYGSVGQESEVPVEGNGEAVATLHFQKRRTGSADCFLVPEMC